MQVSIKLECFTEKHLDNILNDNRGNIPAAVSRPPTWYCASPKINVNDYEPVIPQRFRFSGQVCKCATFYLLDISMYQPIIFPVHEEEAIPSLPQ